MNKYYLRIEDNVFGFVADGIYDILSTDIEITNEDYNKFFELQSQGKQFRLKQNNEIDRKIEFLERCLKSFAIKELEGSKKKSIKLPYGTLSFKKQQDKYEYSEELIMDWLKNNNYTKYINTKTIESVKKL